MFLAVLKIYSRFQSELIYMQLLSIFSPLACLLLVTVMRDKHSVNASVCAAYFVGFCRTDYYWMLVVNGNSCLSLIRRFHVQTERDELF